MLFSDKKIGSLPKRGGDFRSDLALCCCCRCTFAQIKHAAATLALRFRTEQSFLGASDKPLRFAPGSRGNRMFFARKRSVSDRMFFARKRSVSDRMFFARKRSVSGRMLVTKALSQDVMLLAFVPLSLNPKESPSLHSNQPLHIARVSSGMSI